MSIQREKAKSFGFWKEGDNQLSICVIIKLIILAGWSTRFMGKLYLKGCEYQVWRSNFKAWCMIDISA